MQQLERYRSLRLDLGDAARSLLYLARARHDEAIEHDCRHLLKRLAEDRFTVAIVGQHSRGKTTLMNAMLGGEYLPTGILPMTQVVTVVRYGTEPKATYFRRGSDIAIRVPIEEVPALVTRESSTRAELEVERVEIEVPADLLRLGMTFVDTPGVGSADESEAANTHGFLPEADAVVFVTSVDTAVTEPELRLLREVPRSAPVFCVVNKVDLAEPAEAASVASFVEHAVQEAITREEVEVVLLSALRGLRHRLFPSEQESDGGLDAFQQHLEAVLSTARSQVALSTSLDIARDIHDDKKRMLDLASYVERLDADEQASLRAGLAVSADRATRQRERIVAQIGDEAQHALDVEFEAAKETWRGELIPSAESKGREPPRAGASAARAQRPGSSAWWSALNARLSESAASPAFRHAGELGETLDAARVTALEHAGLVLPESARSRWQPLELPGFGRPQLGMDDERSGSEAASPARSRRRPQRDADAALVAFEEHLRQQNVHRLEWIAHDAARQAEANAQRLEHYLESGPTEAELDAMSRIRARLDTISAELHAERSAELHAERATPTTRPKATTRREPTGVPAVRAAPHSEAGQMKHTLFDCAVCAHQRHALIDDLRHRQLLIATRERDQAEFARIGGLCAQHTWTYASLASPVGIASAYAPLASRAADQYAAAQTSGSLIETGTAFGDDPDTCPVCRTVARAEQEALRVLGRASANRLPCICMRHLAAAAAAGLGDEVLLKLARLLSAELRRHAEDMRTYALKREALAGGSLTTEENEAYKETLLLIAGDPLLARPTSPFDAATADWSEGAGA